MLGSGGTVAAAKVVLTADTRDLSRGLARARADAHETFTQLGRGALSGSGALHGLGRAALYAGSGFLGAAGLTLALRGAFHEMEQSQKVAAQTEAVLKSTGGVAGVTAKHVDSLAKSLMTLSGVDDENIKSGENWLLTFKNIRNETGKNNDIFDQATKATLDLAAAQAAASGGQIDMASASTLMGKALNDPIRGVTALQRVGVTFTAGQRELIKSLVESGHTLDAQKVILKEVNSQVAGSAEAFGNTLPGRIAIMRESIANLGGELLQTLAPAITVAVTKLTEWVGWLATSESFHAALRKGIDGLVTAFDKTRMVVEAIIPVFKGFWDVIVEVGKAVVTITKPILQGFKDIFAVFQTDGGDPGHGKSTMRQLHDVAKTVGDILHDYVVPAIRLWAKVMAFEIKVMAKIVTTEVKVIVGVIRGIITIVHAVETAVRAMVTTFRSSWGAVSDIVASFVAYLGGLPGAVRTKASAIGHAVVSGVTGGLRGLVDGVRGMFGDLWDWIRGTAADSAKAIARNIGLAIMQGIISGIGDLASSLKDKLTGAVSGAIGGAKHLLHIGSPSRLTKEEIGIPLGEGIIAGVEESLAPLGDVLVSKISAAHSRGREAVDTLRSGSTGSGVSAPQVNEDKVLSVKIDKYLEGKGSPMRGEGVSFVAAGRKYGIDPRYLVALTGAESSFGVACFHPFNPFGYHQDSFGSWREAIFTVAKALKENYVEAGQTSVFTVARGNAASTKKYGSPHQYTPPNTPENIQEPFNVERSLREQGGDPSDITFPKKTAPSSAPASRPAGRIVHEGRRTYVVGQEGHHETRWERINGRWEDTVTGEIWTPKRTTPRSKEPTAPTQSRTADAAVAEALSHRGEPYAWGGQNPGGFDCSGIIYYAYQKQGIDTGRTSQAQWAKGTPVSSPLPGDGCYYTGAWSSKNNGPPPRHAALYVGNGNVLNFRYTGSVGEVMPYNYRGDFMGFRRFSKETAGTKPATTPGAPPVTPPKPPDPGFGGGKTGAGVTAAGNRAEAKQVAAAGLGAGIPGLAGVLGAFKALESGTRYQSVSLGKGLGRVLVPVSFTPTIKMWKAELARLKKKLRAALARLATHKAALKKALAKRFPNPQLVAAHKGTIAKLNKIVALLRQEIVTSIVAIRDLIAEAKSKNQEEAGEVEDTPDIGDVNIEEPAGTGGTEGPGYVPPDADPSGGGGGGGDTTPPATDPGPSREEIQKQLEERMQADWVLVLGQRKRFLDEFASNTFTGQPGSFGYGTNTLPIGKPLGPPPIIQNFNFTSHPTDPHAWMNSAAWHARTA